MPYRLKFLPTALKEWEKLDNSLRNQFKKKLKERMISPHVKADLLRGFPNHYKIKLRTSGYRLVYQVLDADISVVVIVIGRRNKNKVYKTLSSRSHLN